MALDITLMDEVLGPQNVISIDELQHHKIFSSINLAEFPHIGRLQKYYKHERFKLSELDDLENDINRLIIFIKNSGDSDCLFFLIKLSGLVEMAKNLEKDIIVVAD